MLTKAATPATQHEVITHQILANDRAREESAALMNFFSESSDQSKQPSL